ncbi:hypothetical protein [Nonomuraea sediminis]|uniref:hypothetical protein n=1 Tax=Nonomuraea sediminis TaxID=2835864 RepID=UPI001BDC7A5C|nr:hypothetical protein [Nonomuraea sediminis]
MVLVEVNGLGTLPLVTIGLDSALPGRLVPFVLIGIGTGLPTGVLDGLAIGPVGPSGQGPRSAGATPPGPWASASGRAQLAGVHDGRDRHGRP